MKRATPRFFLLIGLSVLVTSCGLAASEEERIARAGDEMQAGDYRAAMIELKNVLGSNSDSVTARLMLAEVSLGLADVLAAEKELVKAGELGATDSDVRPLQMRVLLAKGDFAGVLAALGMETPGLSKEQQLQYRGEALLALGNTEPALETYREWLEIDPTSVDARIGLANSVAVSGDLEGAAKALQDVTAEHPENFKAWQGLGVVQFGLGDYESANESFSKSLELIKPQTDIRRYASLLAGLTECNLALNDIEAARLNLNRLTGVSANSPAALFLAARVARRDGDFTLAARHLQNLLNLTPNNGRAQLFLANMQMMQGNFAQAENLLNRVVARSPGNIQARKMLAQLQLRQAEPTGAVEALAPLIESGEGDADLYTILAQASIQQGNPAEAVESYQKAAELAPDDVETQLNLASAYFFTGDAESALRILGNVSPGEGANFRRERLLMLSMVAEQRTEEADAIAESLLASTEQAEIASAVAADYYLRTGRKDQASEILRRLVESHPEMNSAKTALASLELGDGNLDAAEELFSLILESENDDLRALLGLARVAQLQGDSDRMIELLQQASEAHPEALPPRVFLAQEFMRLRRLNEAESLVNELIAIGFTNSRISEFVANVLMQVGRSDDAVSQYKKAAALDPNSPSIQLGIARAYLALDRSVDARAALDHALELSPGWPPAIAMLALLEVSQGKFDDAVALVEQFQALQPDNPAAYVLEGEVMLYAKKYTEAAQAFGESVAKGAGVAAVIREHQARIDGSLTNPERPLQAWLETKPEDTVARRFLAQYYQGNNRGQDAIREYEKVLEATPDDATILNNLAWQYQQQKDFDRAVALAEKARSLAPQSGSIADTLGWIYYEMGQLEKSVELLADASRLSSDNGEIRYHLAVALADSGDKNAAREILRQLQEDDKRFPSRALAEELLGQL